jgi:hypothetical protein
MLAADVLLAATGILGLLVVTMWTPTTPTPLVWILAVIVGLTIALDSRPEVASNEEAVRMLLGSGLGAMVALVIVFGDVTKRPGQLRIVEGDAERAARISSASTI